MTSYEIIRTKNGYLVANADTYSGDVGKGQCWVFKTPAQVAKFIRRLLTEDAQPKTK